MSYIQYKTLQNMFLKHLSKVEQEFNCIGCQDLLNIIGVEMELWLYIYIYEISSVIKHL